MNSRRRTSLFLGLALLAAAGCGVRGKEYETTINRSWPAASLRSVELREVNGSVDIQAGSADQVTLVAHVRSRGIAPVKGAENEGFFKSAVEGDTLHIGRMRKHKVNVSWFGSDDVSVDYTLRVPQQIALDLTTVNGRIATRGVEGETEISTVNGPIQIETPGTQELSATTVNGKVQAKFLKAFQGAKLKTVNGTIRAELPEDASFYCDLSQVNGDFEAAFPLAIHSHPGSRRVSGEVNGGRFPLRIVTVNGDVTVEHIGLPKPPAAPAAPNGAAPLAPPAPPAPPAPIS